MANIITSTTTGVPVVLNEILASNPDAVLVADRNQKRRLDEEDLVVSACFAGQGPTQKRVRPAPMGRAYRVIKRTAHITVRVAERE